MHAFLLPLLTPLCPIITIFTPCHPIVCRPKKHTPPLRKMHHYHRKSATHNHHPHIRQPCRSQILRAHKEHQLGQTRSKVPAGPSHPGYDSERLAGNEGEVIGAAEEDAEDSPRGFGGSRGSIACPAFQRFGLRSLRRIRQSSGLRGWSFQRWLLWFRLS